MSTSHLARALGACTFILVSAEAAAQPSVTFSGFVDAGVYKLAQQKTTLGNIQRSYWGMSGTEDLGGGYAATFNLVSRFEVGSGRLEASGASPLFYGESTVGLSGPFGKLRLGRSMTPMWTRDGMFDPWYNFDRVASVAWQIFHPSFRSDPYGKGAVGDYNRLSNGVFYDSPSVDGWSAHASVGVDRSAIPDANGDTQRKRSLAGALNYEKGAWTAMVSAERNSADDRTYFVAGAVKTGASRLMATLNLTNLSMHSQALLGDLTSRRTSATVGATHQRGNTTYKLGLGRDFQGYGAAGATDYLSLGAEQALSKRTRVYVGAGYRDRAHARSGTNLGLGMSHSF